jgi:hypothetical protein
MITCLYHTYHLDKYIISLICFATMNFSELYCIDDNVCLYPAWCLIIYIMVCKDQRINVQIIDNISEFCWSCQMISFYYYKLIIWCHYMCCFIIFHSCRPFYCIISICWCQPFFFAAIYQTVETEEEHASHVLCSL